MGNKKAKKGKSAQFVGQTKASRAIFASQSGNIHNIRFTVGGGGEVAEIYLFHKKIFGSSRAQSEKVGQISFCPPNFFLPVRPWLSDYNLT